MNIVTFPGLNFEFEFSNVAFSLFGISVYKYAVCIVLGIILSLILCKISREKFDVDYNFLLENVIIGIFFGIIGARFYYVLFNLDYYVNNFREIFNFRKRWTCYIWWSYLWSCCNNNKLQNKKKRYIKFI